MVISADVPGKSDAKGEAKSGDAKSGDAKGEAKSASGEAKSVDAKPDAGDGSRDEEPPPAPVKPSVAVVAEAHVDLPAPTMAGTQPAPTAPAPARQIRVAPVRLRPVSPSDPLGAGGEGEAAAPPSRR